MSRSATKRLQQINRDRTKPPSGAPPSFGGPERDDQVVSMLAFIAGTAMIFLLIASVAVVFGTSSIERNIQAQTETALRRADFQNITVEVDGFTITLQGYYHESRTAGEVLEAVSVVPGVREIDATELFVIEVNEVDPTAVTGEPITIAWANGVVTITGDVSSEEIQTYLASEPLRFTDQQEAEVFRTIDAEGVVIIEDLAPVEGLADEADWMGSVMALLRSLAIGLDEGSIIINPSGKVVITSGEVETRQEKRDIEDAIEESVLALVADGFVVTPGIILPPDPFTATREEVEVVTATLTELIGDKVVEFELNSAELTPVGVALLDEILVVLRDFPNVPVEIAGHADASGTPEHNLELSLRRAEAVAVYFVSKGEDPIRFIVEGYGDTQPIPGATAEQNRRIEFIPLEG